MKPRKLLILTNDPLKEYYKKGELIDCYFNPCNFFDEVCFISLSKTDIDEDKIQHTVGSARARIFPIGEINPSIFLSFSKLRKRISEVASEFQPDCIRAYNAHIQGFLGAGLSEKLNVPFVVSLHINPEKDIRAYLNPFICFAKWLFWEFSKYALEPFALKKADKIICVYNFIYDFAKNLCKDCEKIEVIYNRIDMDQFKPTERNNISCNDINILCVGRLFERKNPEHLIKAMSGINAKLIVIGDGPYRNKLKKIVNALNLDDKVHLVSSVPNKEIHKYYQEADIFVSVNDYGGISKVVIEAMASGLPIIVNQPRCELYPELLEDSAVITKNSSVGFINSINQLIANLALRYDLGKRNREKALKSNGTIMERREMDVYRSLITSELK